MILCAGMYVLYCMTCASVFMSMGGYLCLACLYVCGLFVLTSMIVLCLHARSYMVVVVLDFTMLLVLRTTDGM